MQAKQVNNGQHVMILEATRASGAEEWFCPTCGRRLLVTWAPAHKRVVLAQGDFYATHSASKGEGFSLGVVESVTPDISNANGFNDEQLSSWKDWLEEFNWGDF